MQQKFIFFSCLTVVCTTLAAGVLPTLTAHHGSWSGYPRGLEVAAAPVRLGPPGAPLQLVGAWTLTARDNRFGGWSAIRVEGGRATLIGDRGHWLVMALPTVDAGAQALPARLGPFPPEEVRTTGHFEMDAESLARDPGGRGWWVGVEGHHRLMLWDERFTRILAVRNLFGIGSRPNRGIEGLATINGQLVLALEQHAPGGALRAGNPTYSSRIDITPAPGWTSDIDVVAGEIFLLRRIFGPGLQSYLARADGARPPIRLPNGWRDNLEGVSIVPRPDGSARIWLVSDNDFRAAMRTLLIALDAPPGWLPAARRDAVR